MKTVREAIKQAASRFVFLDNQRARFEAQVLLCFVLGIDRSALFAYPERILTPEQERVYNNLVDRRCEREPIAYLIGLKEFYGLEFFVDQRVLIPRPETELLVEQALQAIRSRLDDGQIPVVADIGTGSGAIPITLAVEEPRLPYLYACDISSDALAVAAQNCQLHHVEQRVRLLQGDLAAPLPEPVDLLLANLPYVGTEELSIMEPDVYRYEPHLALFSGPDGLDTVIRLCKEVFQSGTLRAKGTIMLEIGFRQCTALAQFIRDLWPQATITCKQDYAGHDRLLLVSLV